MVRFRICAGLVLAALLGAQAKANAPEVPAEAFAALPQVSDVQLSQFPGASANPDYWKREIGSQFDKGVVDRSPVNSADDVTAAVLLLHGTDDTYVPFSQSERIAGALARSGKPVTLVKLQGDDHGLSKAPTRLEALEAVGAFLHQYLN